MLITWTGVVLVLVLTITTELLTKVYIQTVTYNQLGFKKKLKLALLILPLKLETDMEQKYLLTTIPGVLAYCLYCLIVYVATRNHSSHV